MGNVVADFAQAHQLKENTAKGREVNSGHTKDQLSARSGLIHWLTKTKSGSGPITSDGPEARLERTLMGHVF